MTGKILNVTPDEYHLDPCGVPSLSASIANVLLSQSPEHAWQKHPRFGSAQDGDGVEEGETPKETEALTNGKVIHKLILRKGSDIVSIDARDFKTNIAKECRDRALNKGKIPMLTHKLTRLADVALILQEKCKRLGYEFTGDSEVAIEWTDAGAAGPVTCRSMLDHVIFQKGAIYDLKTIRNAHPRHIARTFVEHGYDLQYTAYKRALAALDPKREGRVSFTFLFMELQPPYAIVPAKPDGALIEVGKSRWRRALQLWETCVAKNEWPGYCVKPHVIEAPPWVIEQELGSEGG